MLKSHPTTSTIKKEEPRCNVDFHNFLVLENFQVFTQYSIVLYSIVFSIRMLSNKLKHLGFVFSSQCAAWWILILPPWTMFRKPIVGQCQDFIGSPGYQTLRLRPPLNKIHVMTVENIIVFILEVANKFIQTFSNQGRYCARITYNPQHCQNWNCYFVTI